MPIYLYSNPSNPSEIVEVMQSVKDPHIFERGGQKWDREFTVPQASVDTQINPESKQDYDRYTQNKKGTIGDIQKFSRELSDKRAAKNGGVDPQKQKFYEKYSKERNGRAEHPQKRAEKVQKRIDKLAAKAGLKVDMSAN